MLRCYHIHHNPLPSKLTGTSTLQPFRKSGDARLHVIYLHRNCRATKLVIESYSAARQTPVHRVNSLSTARLMPWTQHHEAHSRFRSNITEETATTEHKTRHLQCLTFTNIEDGLCQGRNRGLGTPSVSSKIVPDRGILCFREK